MRTRDAPPRWTLRCLRLRVCRCCTVSKHSLKKDDAWKFISFYHDDELMLRNIVSGGIEPNIVEQIDSDGNATTFNQLDPDAWREAISDSLEKQRSEDITQRELAVDLQLRSFVNATSRMEEYQKLSDTQLDDYLDRIRLELSDERNFALDIIGAYPDEEVFYALKANYDSLPAFLATSGGQTVVNYVLSMLRDVMPTGERLNALMMRYRKMMGISTNSVSNDVSEPGVCLDVCEGSTQNGQVPPPPDQALTRFHVHRQRQMRSTHACGSATTADLAQPARARAKWARTVRRWGLDQ